MGRAANGVLMVQGGWSCAGQSGRFRGRFPARSRSGKRGGSEDHHSSICKGESVILTLRLDPQEDELVEQLKRATGQSAASKAVMLAAGSFIQLSKNVEAQRAELEALQREFAEYRQVVERYKAARHEFDNL